jgi:hypothetical protein
MAPKSAKQPTDRVTVRLPVNQIRSMQGDALGKKREMGPRGERHPPGNPGPARRNQGGAHTPCNHSLEPLLGTPKSRT